ncbi:MAG: Na(+)-translocating NADH-quinone reductase subunit A [Gammaproteobacteria bacterium]|nr:Na(+)-translocating NADH-quinone reductase subunit A [Gammaproteobacteria bacterium]NNF59720.1 Na(+)-translocating NADH-quinone reductase subunit A [Gammaproteobacteria bacterium]
MATPPGHRGTVLKQRRDIRIRRGLDVPIAGTPKQEILDAPATTTVALLGRDYPGLRPELLVRPGDSVTAGQPVARDRRHPDFVLTSPGSGSIEAIQRGARRRLTSIVIRLASGDPVTFPAIDPAAGDRALLQQRLLESGLWSAFRTRPFSRIPQPGAEPAAIFVTAIDTNPLAADPAIVLDGQHDALRDGLTTLAQLTDGSVYFCRGPELKLELPALPQLVDAVFRGPHPAGLPGTHIHFLEPAGPARSVWHVGYQDVVAMGKLVRHGELSLERVIAIGGPSVAQPRLLRTRIGASTDDLVAGELEPGPCRVVSGPLLSGHRAAADERFLGRYHQQLIVLPDGGEREFLGWMAPGLKKYSSIGAFASSLLPRRNFRLTTSLNGSARAIVPIGNFEKVMPLDVLPVPLLKALLVRDADSARELGALELDEEDLALCSFVCCSKHNYGPALRHVLDKLEHDG